MKGFLNFAYLDKVKTSRGCLLVETSGKVAVLYVKSILENTFVSVRLQSANKM